MTKNRAKLVHDPAKRVQVLVRFTVRRKDGSLRYDSGRREGRCFVLQWLQILHTVFQNATITVKDTLNADRVIPYRPTDVDVKVALMFIGAESNDSTFGLVIGTSDAAEGNANYALGAQIVHGAGAGEMLHGSMGFTAPVVAVGNVDYVMERAFTNGSGDAITVEEIGVYARVYTQTGGVQLRYFLVVRDLTGGVAVGDGETLTVEYTWRTTV